METDRTLQNRGKRGVLLYHLLCLPYLYLTAEILDRLTVRVHSRIVEKGRSWCRLWYLVRALDLNGAGYASIPLAEVCQILNASSSTVYQWLREAEAVGAFRHYKIREGILTGHLGGLATVSKNLGLESPTKGILPWGTTFEIPLHEIVSLGKIRAAATAATTQRLQQLSRYAAWRALPAPKRKFIKLPQPDAFFPDKEGQRLSDDIAVGSIRCLIHLGKRRAWVSRGFVPFGTSQHAIARERGVCDRTVQRHLALMNVERRQIVQSKAEYRLAASAVSHDAGAVEMADNFALYARGDDYYLSESGIGGTHIHKVATVGFSRIQSRFFQYGSKPKIWLYRCNIYKPDLKLCTMSAARSRYHRHQRTTNPARRGDTTLCNAPLNSSKNFPEDNAIPAE